MSENEQAKAITSLLLYSEVPKGKCDSYLARCDALIGEQRYNYQIPPLTRSEIGKNHTKCSFDFTSHLPLDLRYDLSISKFMETHDRFICDLLSIDQSISVYLSALITIDPSLAVFELKSPTVPETVTAFRAFQFDYWVWHIAESGE
jgi:hypothetical protein